MKLKYDIDQLPKKKSEHILLSMQHVFAMFGATILVPTLIGLDVGVGLFCAGLGTLIYSFCTQQKVPVFIGSSFAYIGICSILMKDQGILAVSTAVMSVGLLYMVISVILKFCGTKWLDFILPPVVMGPLIIVIGLSLAPVAIMNSGMSVDSYNLEYIAVSVFTLIITLIALEKGNNFIKSIPILIGIISGYILSLILGLVDTSIFNNLQLIDVPNFSFTLLNSDYKFNLDILFAVIPLVIVTVSEHIGDHTISSVITNKNFLKDPGLKRTLFGDGLASFVAGLIGGPVNTTYAENTGVIILTRVASVKVIQLAAVFAIVISFLSPITLFIKSIPSPVMGGISIVLFGLIAQNGIRVLIESKINFNHTRNMIICALILVIGLGGGVLSFTLFNINFAFQGISLAAIFGIMAHAILPDHKVSFKQD